MTRPFIMVAPNGARKMRSDHPALPISLDETLETARACHAAGADALHLHIRDADGQHSLDPGRYREALSALAVAVPEMRVQITTEAAGRFSVADQLATLTALTPPWASLALREVARDPALADRIYGFCAEAGVKLQHLLYSAEDAGWYRDWRARGWIRKEQDAVLFVLGSYVERITGRPAMLQPYMPAISGDWMVCAFGPREHDCLVEAARHGGALRVGFENSLTTADGTPHRDNAASVARLIAQLKGTDR